MKERLGAERVLRSTSSPPLIKPASMQGNRSGNLTKLLSNWRIEYTFSAHGWQRLFHLCKFLLCKTDWSREPRLLTVDNHSFAGDTCSCLLWLSVLAVLTLHNIIYRNIIYVSQWIRALRFCTACVLSATCALYRTHTLVKCAAYWKELVCVIPSLHLCSQKLEEMESQLQQFRETYLKV